MNHPFLDRGGGDPIGSVEVYRSLDAWQVAEEATGIAVSTKESVSRLGSSSAEIGDVARASAESSAGADTVEEAARALARTSEVLDERATQFEV